MNPRIPVIVDDDGSPDGILALLYFLCDPQFDVIAATVSYGEAHPEVFAPRLAQLLAGLGRADIPVGVGRADPLEGNNAFPDPWRERCDDMMGLPLRPASAAAVPEPAVELIINRISRSVQPVLVFISGAHTTLAQVLKHRRDVAGNIRAVYSMGGAIYRSGNITAEWPGIDNPYAEWNIWCDPVAAHEVFRSGLPLYLSPLDSTEEVIWTECDAQAWDESGSPEGALAADLLHRMLHSWAPQSVFIWDLVAAVHAADPATCQQVPLALDVVTESGPQQGRTAITDGPLNVTVCLHSNAARIKARIAATLRECTP